MDFKELESKVSAAFHDSVIQHLKIDEVRRFITVPVPNQRVTRIEMFSYGSTPEAALVHEYADYLNVTEDNAVDKAKILGAGCAILYNALIKNVRLTFQHNVIIDLLENKNLKFTFVINVFDSLKPGLTLKTLEDHAH